MSLTHRMTWGQKIKPSEAQLLHKVGWASGPPAQEFVKIPFLCVPLYLYPSLSPFLPNTCLLSIYYMPDTWKSPGNAA